ncbi:MAG TPA: glycoside hydrolase [Longimicrobiaceae bacterium]|nr:glycoside hydrolase [Longimicrobiaceae bacterium]
MAYPYVKLAAGIALAAGAFAATAAARPPERLEIILRPLSVHQTIRGFGASDAWSVQFVGKSWPLEKRERVADLLFSLEERPDGSPVGIGLSLWRFDVGAGSTPQGAASNIRDRWRRTESFLRPDGGYDWSRKAGQRWFLRAAKERGVEHFTAFSNSPPVAFTRNGRANSSGGDSTNLAADRYEDFAGYLTRVVAHLQESEGVHFDFVSPVNEPQWDWKDGQEGSPWRNAEIARVTRALARSLEEAGLDTKVKIGEAGKLTYLYERADRPRRGDQLAAFFERSSPLYLGDLPNVARGLSGHSYWTTYPADTLVAVRARVRARLEHVDPGLEFWQTEYCLLENNPRVRGAGRPEGMDAALYAARVLHADLTVADASVWNWWLAVSPYDFKDGLVYVDRDTLDGTVSPSKLLWALGHYSRFVRPGMERISVSRSDSAAAAPGRRDVLVSAFTDPARGRSVAVVVNTGADEVRMSFAGAGARRLGRYLTTAQRGDDLRFLGWIPAGREIRLPPRSMMTVVFD